MNLHRTRLKTFSIMLASTLLLPGSAFATNGYFSHGWGMKSKGMAGAGLAKPVDAIAAATNPAGMALIGNRLDFGLDIFKPKRSATISGAGSPPLNETQDGNGDELFFIPEFGYNKMINKTMSFGVSVYGNGGMNSSYKNGIRYFASQGEAGVNLSQLFIAPTFAMKINDKHSFGVSLNIGYQTFEAKGIQGFCNTTFSNASNNCTNQGEDTSYGYGVSVGWLGQLSKMISLGVSYRSETEMSEFDKYKGLFAENGKFNIPAMYGIGLNIKAGSRLDILFDINQIKYSDVPAISNPISNLTVNGNKLGTANGGGFGWDDMTVYKLGFEFQLSKATTLRAGWNHGAQPIPASETLFNILAPATVEDHLTLGATWTLANKSEITVAYMHAFENEVKGSNSIPTSGGFAGGEADIKMSQDSLGIAYGWNF